MVSLLISCPILLVTSGLTKLLARLVGLTFLTLKHLVLSTPLPALVQSLPTATPSQSVSTHHSPLCLHEENLLQPGFKEKD